MQLPSFGIPAKILAGKDSRFQDVAIYYRARMKQALVSRVYASMETRSNARKTDPVAGKWVVNHKLTIERKGHGIIGVDSGEMFGAMQPGTATINGYIPNDARQKVTLTDKSFQIDISAVWQAVCFEEGINSWGRPQPKRPIFPPSTKEAWWPWFHDSHMEVMPDVKAFYITRLTEYRAQSASFQEGQRTSELTPSQNKAIIALRNAYKSWQELSLVVFQKLHATIVFTKQTKQGKQMHQYQITPRGKITKTFTN